MPRQKLKPWPNVSAVGNFGRAPRPNPPNAPRPNCAAAVAATQKTSTAARRVRSFMTCKSQIPDWDLGFLLTLFCAPGERPEILLVGLLVRFRRLVAARQRQRVLIAFHLAAEAELEPLQALGDDRLQPGERGDVLIDARILHLPQRLHHFLELPLVDVHTTRPPQQLAGIGVELTRFVPQLPDVFLAQTSAVPPAAPGAVIDAAAVDAAAVEAAVAKAITEPAVSAALTILGVLSLPLTLALSLPLALLTLLALTLLTLTLLTLTLALALLALLPFATLLALLPFATLLALLAITSLLPLTLLAVAALL